MNTKRELIDVMNLKPGMITSNDIVHNGVVLIGKGIKLTDSMLDKLKSLYEFDMVEVISDKKSLKESETLEEVKATLKNVAKNIEYLFKNSNPINSSTTNEINNYSRNLLNQVKINNNIIKSIILTGSGEDTIYLHSVNVAILSYLLGKWSNMSENKLQYLMSASLLHDFGKVKIDKSLIEKPSKLTKKEYEIVKTHTILAYNEIKEIPFISKSVLYGVLMHHERCDGTGYPLGLSGDQIHEFARIISITDTFDAINSNRPYKKTRKPLTALKIIKDESLKTLDYSLCNTFLKGLENYYIGEHALLSNNCTCKIIQLNHNNFESPLVFSNNEFIDLSQNKELSIIKLL